jgi:hypothetical protein
LAKRSKTSDKVRGYQQVYDSYAPISTFTRISPQRLRSIAQGSKATASERAKITAFSRREQEGHVTFALQAAAKKRGVSMGALAEQLQSVARGEVIPKGKIGLPEISHIMGVDPAEVRRRSTEPVPQRWGKRGKGYKDPRGITEAFVTKEGRIVAWGTDGNRYVAYKVTNKQTGEASMFWGNYQSVGYMSSSEFAEHYGDDDDFAFDLDFGFDEFDFD